MHSGMWKEQDVNGQVQLLEDPYFDILTANPAEETDGEEDNAASKQKNNIQSNVQKDHQTKLKLIYPVGRHLGFRSIFNNMMNFVRLPSDVKNVTSICLNPQKTVMAVAVRNNDVEGFEHLNLSIYFYVFGQTSIVTHSAKQPI